MQSPFPGMDPYLEASDLWPDVHLSLASALRDQLQPQLGTRYIAALTPYVAFETINIAPSRYANIEIRTLAGQTLVTAIKILSPVNKRPGRDGADAYDRKRRELLRSEAHLLEIDLLRAGQRPALMTPQLASSYSILLSRVEQRPEVEIWPIRLPLPIPEVPIPLQKPDADVTLDIQSALEQVYRNARYDLRIDYRLPPAPPDLSPEDVGWIEQVLRDHGLRAG